MGNVLGFKGFRAHGLMDTLSRTGIGNLLGFQMGGLRNLYAVFGWKTALNFNDFYRKYKRHSVARRVVDAYPNALWSDPPVIQADAAFQTAWQNLLAEQPLFPTLQKLDKLCRIGKFAVMLVGVNDGKKLDQPLTRKAGNKVIYLQPYAECSVQIKTLETNTASPRYNQPVSYTIYPGNFDAKGDSPIRGIVGSAPSFNVHWTRLLHVSESALESSIYGSSCLEPIYNDLDDLEKISGGASEVFWLNSNRGLHIDVDKEMELKGSDADALEEEIDEYSNNLRRVIRTRGVKINNLGTDFLDPTGPYNVPLANISAATGIPRRAFMGSEAGQLASQQDRANWADRCDERVAEYANPVVLMPCLRLFIDSGILPVPKQLSVNWPDMFKMNPLERAQTSAQMARSAANLAKTLNTMEQTNHLNAVDATETQIQPAFGGGGGFGANADPTKSSSGTVKTPSGAPKDVTTSPGDTAPAPAPQTTPAIRPGAKTDYQLLTVEECRRIIGFGKHMPVFDSTQDSTAQIGPSASEPSVIPISGE